MAAIVKGLAALAAHPNFILVKLVPSRTKPGKLDKFPCDWRSGQVVDAHNPAIWMPWEQASALLPAWGTGYCLGWVITPATGIWCLDVDNCVTPEDQWSETAKQLFGLLPRAAAELSLSRKGLHFWGSGPVPPHAKKCVPLGLELYTELRFIALTCEVLQGDASADHTAEIASLVASCFPLRNGPGVDAPDTGPAADWRGPTDDEELLRRALRSGGAAAAFGGKASFADLWTANAPALARCYPDSGERPYDASSADAALAQHLAFWTGRDAARVERLMRRSALVRDKWDREDYMVRTVSGACSRQVQVLQDDPVVAPTGAIEALTPLTNDALASQWLAHARGLDKAGAEALVQFVGHRLGTPTPALRAQVKAIHDAEQAAASQVAVAEAAGERALILVRPDAPHVVALEIESAILTKAEPGRFLLYGGVPSQIVVQPLPQGMPGSTPVTQIEPLGYSDLLKVAASTSACYKPRKGGAPEMVEHPKAALDILLHQKSGGNAPAVMGVVTHPLVRLDGSILSTGGFDATTGLFATASAATPCRAYSRDEAMAAGQRLAANCLPGFRFESEQDRSAALSVFLMTMVRKVLDTAPALAALAHDQASGKTTLARAIHIVATGRDMPVSNLPMRDSDEGEKLISAVLSRNPEMVCFDNIPEGYVVRSKTLTQALTSSVFEARILGVSQTFKCQTNVLIAITGNNLTFAADEQSRFLPVHLTRHGGDGPPDVLRYFMAAREQIIKDVIGVIAGYVQHCGGVLGKGSRFSQWDRLVRYPMIWLGFSDPAASFEENVAQSDDNQALHQLMQALSGMYQGREFTTANLATAAAAGVGAEGPLLRQALHMLGVDRLDNSRQIAHRLGAIIKKPVAGMTIERLPFNPAMGPQFRLNRATS